MIEIYQEQNDGLAKGEIIGGLAHSDGGKMVKVVDQVILPNNRYFTYRVDKVNMYNNRRLYPWFEIFTKIMKRTQFPELFRLIDKEETTNAYVDVNIEHMKKLQENDEKHEEEL